MCLLLLLTSYCYSPLRLQVRLEYAQTINSMLLREGLRGRIRHLYSALREPISRKAAIQHTFGVVHFPVAKEMDDAVLVTHPSSLSTTDEGASRGHDLRRPAVLFLLGRHSSSPASSARSRMTTP